MTDKEIVVKDGIVVEAPESSVIRPGDIRVKTNADTLTVLSSVASDLAVLILTENLEKTSAKTDKNRGPYEKAD